MGFGFRLQGFGFRFSDFGFRGEDLGRRVCLKEVAGVLLKLDATLVDEVLF